MRTAADCATFSICFQCSFGSRTFFSDDNWFENSNQSWSQLLLPRMDYSVCVVFSLVRPQTRWKETKSDQILILIQRCVPELLTVHHWSEPIMTSGNTVSPSPVLWWRKRWINVAFYDSLCSLKAVCRLNNWKNQSPLSVQSIKTANRPFFPYQITQVGLKRLEMLVEHS